MDSNKEAIRELLKNKPRTLFPLEYNITHSVLLELWKNYYERHELEPLREHNMTENQYVNSALHFHYESCHDHIIMYYGLQNASCLLLCKVNGRYLNVEIPQNDLQDYGCNFIATYLPPYL